jgi:DNA-binding transcriptional MocR family regulator
MVHGLSQCGSSRSGGAPSQLTAAILNELLSSSALEEHIDEVLRLAYKRRHAVMLSAVEKELLPLGVKVHKSQVDGTGAYGGYFLWLDLPTDIDAETVSEVCREGENLIVAPGKIFEVPGDNSIKFPSSIRLCFSWEEEGALEEGVKRLARALKEVIEGGKRGSRFEQDIATFK